MRTVRDVMTRTVVTAPEEAPFKELVRGMREYRVSALPYRGRGRLDRRGRHPRRTCS